MCNNLTLNAKQLTCFNINLPLRLLPLSIKLGTAPVSQLIFHQDNIEAGAAEDRFF
jgi:hypothetical protein